VEIFENVGEIAKHILSILALITLGWTGIKYVPKGYRWIRSRTFIECDELDRLRKIDAKYSKCEAELKSLYETCAPILEQKRAELVRGVIGPEVKINSEFDPRSPYKNPK
jgi:hypothetical protein